MSLTEIRFAGSGGQGLILGARMLLRALGADGRSAAQSQNYEPTSRGGLCHSDIVLGEDGGAVDFPLVTGLDYLVILDAVGLEGSLPLLKQGALVITDARLVPDAPKAKGNDFTLHTLSLTDRAIALGSHRVANIVGLGVLAGLADLCPRGRLETAIGEMAPKKFLGLNLEALEAGYEMAAS
jgi:2-oxoglutarate ferredoxin oxidoreductase subunit gamma